MRRSATSNCCEQADSDALIRRRASNDVRRQNCRSPTHAIDFEPLPGVGRNRPPLTVLEVDTVTAKNLPNPAHPEPRLRVLMFPKHGDNPYLRSLVESLEQRGIRVDDFSFTQALKQRYDVLHIHWPDLHLHARSSLRVLVKHARLALLFAFLRLRNTRIVWTLHNLAPHERHLPLGEFLFPLWFPRLCTHIIALTKNGLAAALSKYPPLRKKTAAVIPHGHYRDAYATALSRAKSRDQLGLKHQFTFLFFGNIRPYKNVPLLIEAFRQLPHPDVQLVIAGQPGHTMQTDELQKLAAADPRIRLTLEFVSEDDVPLYVGASDVVVLPFRSVLNSGSVFLALSFNRAVLAPNLGALPEIKSHVGARWVTLYDGQLTTEHLLRAMDSIRIGEHETVDLSAYDWQSISQATVELYLTRTGASGSEGTRALLPHR
jgi:beta-1,4-mannosyltransferase